MAVRTDHRSVISHVTVMPLNLGISMPEVKVTMPSGLLVLAETLAHRVICWAVWVKWTCLTSSTVDICWMKSQSCDSFGRRPSAFPVQGVVETATTVTGRHLKGTVSRARDKNLVLYETAYPGNMHTLILIADLAPKSLGTLSSLHFLVRKQVIGQDSLHDFRPQNPSILRAEFTSPRGSWPALARWVNRACGIDKLRQAARRAHHRPLGGCALSSEPSESRACFEDTPAVTPYTSQEGEYVSASADSNWAAETEHHGQWYHGIISSSREQRGERSKASLGLCSHVSVKKEIWKGITSRERQLIF